MNVDGRAAFARECAVSRETMDRLDALVAELARWTRRINLVSPASMADVWRRHVLDSAQLYPLAPAGAATWADLGSGAGFPGLVIAAIARERNPALRVTLIESDVRKCAFLASCARLMALDVAVENRRIEAPPASRYDVVSARALAPLPALLALAAPYMAEGGVGLFPKGAGVDRELTEALKTRHIDVARSPSITDPDGVILILKGVSRVGSGA